MPRSLGVRIVNIVATSDLNQKIDLEAVGSLPWGSHKKEGTYKRRVAYFKKFRMKGKVILFSNGKMISVGATSEREARAELHDTLESLVSEGLAENVPLTTKIQNVVASAKLGFQIDLEKLARNVPDTVYEPAQFANVMLLARKTPRVNVSISSKGTFLITGAKSASSARKIAKEIGSILNDYKRA